MSTKKSFFFNFLFQPLLHGVGGFFLFLTILLLTKLLAFWLGTNSHFSVELEDAVLSIVGFVLLGLIRLLDNFKSKELKQAKN